MEDRVLCFSKLFFKTVGSEYKMHSVMHSFGLNCIVGHIFLQAEKSMSLHWSLRDGCERVISLTVYYTSVAQCHSQRFHKKRVTNYVRTRQKVELAIAKNGTMSHHGSF